MITTPDSEPSVPAPPLPDKATFKALIERFGQSWESGDGAAIAEVFTEDGAFFPMPFDPPARGRDAIREYWKSTPKEQADIAFRFGEVFVAGPWFSVEFKTTFRRRRTGELVEVRGALFCESDAGKIAEMRMYWHRTVGR